MRRNEEKKETEAEAKEDVVEFKLDAEERQAWGLRVGCFRFWQQGVGKN